MNIFTSDPSPIISAQNLDDIMSNLWDLSKNTYSTILEDDLSKIEVNGKRYDRPIDCCCLEAESEDYCYHDEYGECDACRDLIERILDDK